MIFVNYRQLVEDTRRWSSELPSDIIAVAGVPRSGILPASIFALHRNIQLITIDQLSAGKCPWEHPHRRIPARSSGRILVLEDSVNTGETMLRVRESLQYVPGLIFGSLYYSEPLADCLDVAFRAVPHPRSYEWNLFHGVHMRTACLDMDGVICADWLEREEDDGPEQIQYLEHLENARPRHLPTFPVHAIVTSRLEKFRPQTVVWLQQHGVAYQKLVMSPHRSANDRREAADHATRKAEYYLSQPHSTLFVESSPHQACTIAQISNKPVICSDTMELATQLSSKSSTVHT